MNTAMRAKAYNLPLRSKLIDLMESVPQKRATAQQWMGMIGNLNNIRREEIQRAEIMDILTFFDPSEQLIKTELVDAMRGSLAMCHPTIQSHWRHAFHPSLDVRIMKDQLPMHVENRAKPFVEKAQTCYQHPSMGYWIIRTNYQDLATTSTPNWIVLDPRGKLVASHERHYGWFPTAVEAFDEMHRSIRQRYQEFGKDHADAIFEEYTFMGGNNYQEWFVCLPDWPLPYRDSHFDLEQLLIHIRTTERIDTSGQPLLMVEEIQSPWHADIRVNGSNSDESELELDDMLTADAPFAKEWHELAIKAVIWIAVQSGHERIGFTTGKQQCQRWYEMEGLMNLYDSDVPKCLKKISRQFQCEYDWATIVTRKPDGRVRRTKQGEWIVIDADDKWLIPPVKNKDVALFFLNQRGTQVKEEIRLFTLSPAIRDAMRTASIPLFGW